MFTTLNSAKGQLGHSEFIRYCSGKVKCIRIEKMMFAELDYYRRNPTDWSLAHAIRDALIHARAIKPNCEAPGPWIVPRVALKCNEAVHL